VAVFPPTGREVTAGNFPSRNYRSQGVVSYTEPTLKGAIATMNLFRDLTDPRLMYLKAFLFLVTGGAAALGILVENPDLRTGFLLILTVWSFCRLYYFAFYVIEKYIDPTFRFAGLSSVVRYFLQRNSSH
jgi:hypothetical protein